MAGKTVCCEGSRTFSDHWIRTSEALSSEGGQILEEVASSNGEAMKLQSSEVPGTQLIGPEQPDLPGPALSRGLDCQRSPAIQMSFMILWLSARLRCIPCRQGEEERTSPVTVPSSMLNKPYAWESQVAVSQGTCQRYQDVVKLHWLLLLLAIPAQSKHQCETWVYYLFYYLCRALQCHNLKGISSGSEGQTED